MKFSKFILTLATLLTTGSAVAAGFDAQNEPVFTPGSTGNVLIKAELPQGTAALQFTVTLPEEFTFNTSALIVNQEANLQTSSNVVSDNTYKYVIYSNDNTDISSVNDYLFGFSLTAKDSAGRGSYPLKFTNVIAATASGAETHIADCEVALPVIIPVSQVLVEPTTASIVIGESVQLTANVLPADAEQSVTWEVNNPDVVSVDENGLARGLSVGNARVTARSTDNPNYSAFCDITVNPITATTISLDKTALEVRVGESATLHATVSPDNATNATVSWASSDRSVVTVDENGNLTPLKAGSATVTATTADGTNLSASCAVTVLPPLATGVTLSNASVSLTVKESMTLKATVSPAEAEQKVEWSTSDAKIVTVDATGSITAQSAGSAVITATATDGSGLSASCQVTVADAKVTSITLSKTALGMRIGQSETLTATVLPEYAAKREVTWASDKPTVATVDANGKVTAVALGEATITVAATDGSGVTATCAVTVTNALATAISIDKTEATLRVRQSLKLTATVSPDGAVNAVNWSTNSPDVATVDKDGNVNAFAPGKAVITATTADGTNLSATCSVTVEAALAESVTLDKEKLDMTVGESATLKATVLPDYAGNRNVNWKSSDEKVVTVDANGTMKAVGSGSAVITATAADGSGVSASCQVNVVDAKVTSITLSKTALGMRIGQSETITATVLPEYAAKREVTWTSDKPTVATVDANGKVTAVALGEATITVAATDGSGVTATCAVTVTNALATAISIDKTEATLRVRQSLKLTATVSPDGAVNAVNWSTNAPEIVTVDKDGNVNAIAPGKAVITATTADGTNLSATCSVTVEAALAESVTLDKEKLDMTVGESASLTATVLPDYAGNRNVNWKSSDEKVVTVDANGTVKAVGSGSSVITATAADGSGVSASCQVNVVDAKVTSITLSKTALGMRIGQSETITATVLPEYAAKREVTWASDKPTVATVDANGKVTAVALGEATITVAATDGSGVTATCAVTVTNALATAISIDKTEATLRVRQSLKLTATVSPDGAVNAVNWSTNAPDVATVDKDGNVNAIAPGKAVITATTADGTNLTATCVITVEPALSETVTIDIHDLTLTVGQSQTLTATVLPDFAGNRNVTWQSSNSSIAMVDSNGRVIALAEGTAVITATAADGSGASDQCNVTVERVRATSITIEPTELSIEQGERSQLHASVLPADAENKVVWSCLNPDIATVDSDGNVVALEVGIAVITASTIDGSNLTASCVVTVTEQSGIDDSVLDTATITVENGNEIVVTGISYDTYVRVINTAGVAVYYGTDKRISDLKPGLYIVIVNSTATKVILN